MSDTFAQASKGLQRFQGSEPTATVMQTVSRILDRAHSVLSHDFCPSANRWVYWLKHPMAAVALAGIVALVCGLLINPAALIVLAAVVLIGCLGVVWPLIAVRGIRCEAEFLSSRCRVDEAVEVRLRLQNRWPWPLWGLSVRRGFADPGDESGGIALARVASWSDTGMGVDVSPASQGCVSHPTAGDRHRFSLRSDPCPGPGGGDRRADCLAAFDATGRHAGRRRTPQPRRSPHRPPRRRSGGRAGNATVSGRRFAASGALGTDRPVRPDDRDRTGSPVACAVQLRVDTSASIHRIESDRSSLERTLTVAASILESLHRQHARVDVVLGKQAFPVGSSSGELRRCLDAIARVPFTGETTDSTECTLDRMSRHVSTIVVTTDLALRQHVAHRHRSAGERYIVIRTDSAGDISTGKKTVEGCDCHAWLELAATDPVEMILPESWRRACHVA